MICWDAARIDCWHVDAMGSIRFQAKLHCPATPSNASWAFAVLPKPASDKLPTRAMVSVEGTLAGHPFQTTLLPDGQGGHWLKVEAPILQASHVAVGESITFDIAPATTEPEPEVPPDLQQALADIPEARATWDDITPLARRDWIFWITSGKKAETRSKRIHTACDMLASGKRRACCFDRSGIYSKALSAPKAAE